MENQTQEKRFIIKSFDKFNNKTETMWKNPSSSIHGEKWDLFFWEDFPSSSLFLVLKNIKTPDLDSLMITYHYAAKEWMFLGKGEMIINIDGFDNIHLAANELESQVRKTGAIWEDGFYVLTKEQLKQICDAKEIAVRIGGEHTYFELEDRGLLKFHFMCRSFYADLYADSSYDEWINTIVPPGSEKKDTIIPSGSKNNGGCFIATAAMGDYNHPVVLDLRLFRDSWLLKRDWGLKFTNWYYTQGPKAAKIIEKSILLRKLTFFAIVKPLLFLTKRLN